jgi:subtilisin family serine protease
MISVQQHHSATQRNDDGGCLDRSGRERTRVGDGVPGQPRVTRGLTGVLCLALALVVAASPAQASGSSAASTTGHLSAAGSVAAKSSYIVTLKAGENPRSVAAVAGVSPAYVYEHALVGFAATLNDGQLNALRHHKAVAAIEADQPIEADGFLTETTGSDGQPWGLDRIDQRSGLSHTYSYWSSGTYGQGTGVRAYVIDSGIATANADFGGRATNVYDAFGGNGQDCLGHGTHVAGTIGGNLYGVAKNVMLRGVRVMGCDGRFLNGSLSTAIAGVDWVRGNAVKPAVANMSWHTTMGKSPALNTATTNLVNSGVFVSVAAANENADSCNDSPSSAAGTLTVAASDWTDTRANFSDYGPCVDLYAPGISITSTWLNGGTNTLSGTSMASPHVAGVAALLKSDYGDRASSTINSWILNATTTNVINANITGTPNRLLYMSGW